MDALIEVLQSDIKDSPTGYVEFKNKWSASNYDEINRVKMITQIAAVSRGKDESNNPELRYKKLLKEAAPKTLHTLYQYSLLDLFKKNYYTDYSMDTGRGIISIDILKDLKELPSQTETGMASRVFEFMPVVLEFRYEHEIYEDFEQTSVEFLNLNSSVRLRMDINTFNNTLAKYGYIDESPFAEGYIGENRYALYTNFRAVYNTGMPYEFIPYLTDESIMEQFVIIKLKVPMFVFNHLVTHTQLSKITKSDRVSEQGMDYWLPDDFGDKLFNMSLRNPEIGEFCQKYDLISVGKIDYTAIIDMFVNKMPMSQIRELLKLLGYKKEIYQRALLEFRYKETIFAGWKNNIDTWVNLLFERGAMDYKTWAQKETKEVAYAIRRLLLENE